MDQNKWLCRNGLNSGQVVKNSDVTELSADPRLLGGKFCTGLWAPQILGYLVLCSWLSCKPFENVAYNVSADMILTMNSWTPTLIYPRHFITVSLSHFVKLNILFKNIYMPLISWTKFSSWNLADESSPWSGEGWGLMVTHI